MQEPLVVVFIASCCLVIDLSMIRSVGEFRSTRFHSLCSVVREIAHRNWTLVDLES